jgi:hypothetical protein
VMSKKLKAHTVKTLEVLRARREELRSVVVDAMAENESLDEAIAALEKLSADDAAQTVDG